MGNPRWQPRNGCDGRLMGKHLIQTIQMLKGFLLANHHSHFLAATLDFTSLFITALLVSAKLGCFWLDNSIPTQGNMYYGEIPSYLLLYNYFLHKYTYILPANIFSKSEAKATNSTAGDFKHSTNWFQLALGLLFSQYQNISLQHVLLSLLFDWMTSNWSSCFSFNSFTPKSYHFGVTCGTIKSRIFFLDGRQLAKYQKCQYYIPALLTV